MFQNPSVIINILKMYIDSDEEKQEVRNKTLNTKYGAVFCLEVGQKGQPLILIIHGSGPKNSSKQYEAMLHQYAVRISFLQKYYILAIDCPGYGKSTGSKEAIKTFPLDFLKNILQVLNYKSYFALFGHSQGGASIFNAVYECPSLTEYMIQERPVCGNISRFNGFQTPTLLIYDIEDDGHPLWQGKQLFKNLKNSQIYTFRSSVNPYYVPDNIWNLMLEFFDKNKKNNKNTRSASRDVGLQKRANQLKQSKRELSQETMKKQQSIDSTEESKSKYFGQKGKKKQETIQKKSQLQSIQQCIQQFNIINQKQECSELIVKNKNKNPIILQQQIEYDNQESELKDKTKQQIQKSQIVPEEIHQLKEQKNKPKEQQPQQIQQGLQQDERCSLCLEKYFHPTRINCKHMFCWKCITQAMLVNPKCPLCRKNVEKREQDKKLHQLIVSKMQSSDLKKRIYQYRIFLRMMDSIVFIEVGNTSVLLNTKQSQFSQTKKKYNWDLFALQTANFKFDSVQFNINMGDVTAKPVKVKHPPWTFSNRGTFEFGCEIKIIPKSQYFNPLIVIYRVILEPGRHSRKVAIRRKQFK